MRVEENRGNTEKSDPGQTKLPSSFRDPSGFIFKRQGHLYRQINSCYSESYRLLMDTGLYHKLLDSNLLIPHTEVEGIVFDGSKAWKVIRPDPIGFISYPYEWCFSQLKDAALLTLNIQRIALKYGMTLKDASAFNIQFHKGRPIFIDTLSFEKYVEGQPWTAYRQFCQHFLAPLSLMAAKDVRMNKLLQIYIDGVPLDLASKLLPLSTWVNFGLLFHIHLHAKSEQKHSVTAIGEKKLASVKVSRLGLEGILDSLCQAVEGMKWMPRNTEWGNYYQDTNYTNRAFRKKEEIVQGYLMQAKPARVLDLGANTGIFSRIATRFKIPTVACDIDPAAVEINYLTSKKNRDESLLPILLDLTNPTPGLGWRSHERDPFLQRSPIDCVMALALIHHLAISNNLPWGHLADFFQKMCKTLIIEFVPKEDSQVRRLLRSRADIFPDYNRSKFEEEFSNYFNITDSKFIEDSNRVLYLMKKKEPKN